ncbi:MAG TPA: serine/threonine-protein kinase [Ktedonobacteraceae bacterium]
MAFCCIRQHINPANTMWCEQCESLVAGTKINDFKVISYIGSGSSGAVYLAEQQSLNGRKVVIKILQQPWDQVHADDFQQEAALLASLSHPYILPIYAFGIIYEQFRSPNISTRVQTPTLFPYLVLPYAEQGSIAGTFMREGKQPWSIDRVVSIIQDVAEALDYAHARGVLHRDVKPANLLQMGSHVLLSDLSVASMIDVNKSHLTAPWAGSPAYMAPEVWALAPGRYSDQYALAITCFYLLAGEYPWQRMGEIHVQDWLHLHRNVMPGPLYQFRPDLPPAVSFVLERALKKDPHERYSTVQAFAADLFTASREATQALDKHFVANNRSAANPLYSVPVKVQTHENEWREAVPAGIFTTDITPVSRIIEPNTVPMGLIQDMASARDLESRRSLTSEEGLAEATPATLLPSFVPQGNVGTEPASPPSPVTSLNFARSSTDDAHNHHLANRWLWWTLLLNLLICMLLAAEAAGESGDVSTAGNVLLALWPALLVGLWVGRIYRPKRSNTMLWSICRGVLFGVTDIVLSAVICYVWTGLALTIPHWGHDWLQAGDGLRIFIDQVKLLLPVLLKFFVLGLWVALPGGALIGFFVGHSRSTRSKRQ